jgi:competence protein ComEC
MLFAPVWPTYGVLANILAEPAAPLATILGMLAFVLAPVVPWLAHIVAWLGWVPAAWIAAVAQTTARMPLASLPWLDGIWGAACAVATSVFICLVIVARRSRLRIWGAVGTALTLGLAFAVALSQVVGVTVTRPAEWRIAMCDVGQGDALVVRGFDDRGKPRDILIDTGRHADLVESCLQDLGIDRVEAVVLTHFDADHAGGIEAVYERTEHVLISAPQRESDVDVIRGLVTRGITVTRATSGQRVALGDTVCTVLWPAPGHPSMQGGNPGSISLSVTAPGMNSIFLADLDEESQNALLTKHPALSRVDVLKVAHHGSSDQSARLTNVLRPRLALISAGRDNGYGHPAGKTVRLLESVGARNVRTDNSGLVLVSNSSGDLRVWSVRGGGGAG